MIWQGKMDFLSYFNNFSNFNNIDNFSFVALQETHYTPSSHDLAWEFRGSNFAWTYHCGIIITNPNISLILASPHFDGCILVTPLEWGETLLTVVIVYVPAANSECDSFFSELSHLSFPCSSIMCGDFNCYLNRLD